MRIRLILHEAYHFGENDCTNQIGWFVTDNPPTIGDIFTFESLNARSNGGDCNYNHYKYFVKRTFKCVGQITDKNLPDCIEYYED